MKNGDRVRDRITGFSGIIIAETLWLHGCRRLTVQPEKLHDGKPIEAQSFDEPQLELVKAEKEIGTHRTGGPRPEPKRA